MASTGVMGIAYNRLKNHLRISGGETRIYDIAQQLAEIDSEMLQIFQVDCVDVGRTLPPAGPSDLEWERWTLPDGSPAKTPKAFNALPAPIAFPASSKASGKVALVSDGRGGWVLKEKELVRAVMPKGGLYFDDVYHPLKNVETKKEVDDFFAGSYNSSIGWPPLFSKADAESLQIKARYLHDNTEYAILAGFKGSFLEAGEYLMGFDRYFSCLLRRRDLATYLNEKLTEYYRTNLKTWLPAVKDYVQVGVFGDDYGGQEGPLVSPKLFHELIYPCQKELFQYVKHNSGLFTFLHSCGSIYRLIPDIIEAGIDIINPVQISAEDMAPEKLKSEFGDDITFWGGGVDTQTVFGLGTPEEVKQNVRHNIEVFAPGGGFVFTPVHNVQANVPPENVAAAFQAALEYGAYQTKV
jgi:uroporphyrinogen decarboxylase